MKGGGRLLEEGNISYLLLPFPFVVLLLFIGIEKRLGGWGQGGGGVGGVMVSLLPELWLLSSL